MSDIHQEARSWRLYIQDMIDFGEKVLSYTDGLDRETFIAETLVYDATLRNLELEIQWRDIIATRNHLAHRKSGNALG